MARHQSRSAFVAMPFAERFDGLYRDAIVSAAEDAGVRLIRLTRLPVEQIVPEMEAEIRGSDLSIAVAAGRNPHVFFEIALAHAMRRPCIILAEQEEDVELFRAHYPCHVYGSDMMMLRQQLSEQLLTFGAA